MKSFLKKLIAIIQRGGFAFLYYPVSMIFAACLAFLSIWIIYAEPATGQKLFTSLQWGFAFGALLDMALCVIAKKASGKPAAFILANMVSFLASAGAFTAVYLTPGAAIPQDAAARIFAGMGISFLVFLFVPTFRSKKIQYNQMVFMTVKSFFIAAVYALVIMLGFFFVAFAVQSLLYKEMSEKVYMDIAILSALLGYAFFLGYFPEFKKEESETDERLDKAIRQPRFAEILFQNIMIPILAALTLVLLIWAIRILITKDWPEYGQTVAIFTAYSLVGIFLYLIVSSYSTLVVRIFKKVIPVATLVFLAFEAYPVIDRIKLYGMKPAEYGIALLWLFAASASVLFLVLPIARNRVPSYIAIFLIALFVMPGIGASDLSYSLQAKRLETLLSGNGMLAGGRISANSSVSLKDRQDMTDATNYLFNQENRTAPDWVLASLPNTGEFSNVFGFSQEYYQDRGQSPDNRTYYLNLYSDYTPLAVGDYQYYLSRNVLENNKNIMIETNKGTYNINWDYSPIAVKEGNATLGLVITLGKKEVLNGNLDDYKSVLAAKYPVGPAASMNGGQAVPAADMACVLKGEKVEMKLVFQAVTISKDSMGALHFNFEIEGFFFKETT